MEKFFIEGKEILQLQKIHKHRKRLSTINKIFIFIEIFINKFVETDCIKMFVLDEADEMLSRGFKDQIYQVFKELPTDVQVVLLSATMPVEVLEVTKKFMRDPIQILIKKEELTLEGIRQFFILIEKEVCFLYFKIRKK